MNTADPPDSAESNWDHVITNRRRAVLIDFAEIWAYRDLITSFVHRDFVGTYKQTVLGPFWFIIQPLISTATYAIFFGQVAKIPTQGLPPFLFYMASIITWNYFQGALTRCSALFSGNAKMFSKIYFPRLCMPISNIISLTINSSLQFSMFLAFLIFFFVRGNDVHPNWAILLFPVVVLQLAFFGIGFGCIISALTTRFRDLQLALGFGMQLWMYASCVLFPRETALANLPAKFQWVITLNPIVPAIEVTRHAFMGTSGVPYGAFAICCVLSVLVFLAGTMVFNYNEKDSADKV